MIGAGIVAGFGQLVVDMPTSYFGATDRMTTIGVVYAVSMLACTTGCAIAALAGRAGVKWLFLLTLLFGMAFFLPALTTDVAVAAVILAWQLGVLSRVVFAGSPILRRRSGGPTGDPYRPIAVHALMLSIFATLLVVGFQLTELLAGRIACLLLDAGAIAAALAVLHRDRSIRNWSVASLVLGLVLAAVRPGLETVLGTLGVFQFGLLGIALAEGPAFDELVRQFVQRPALLVLATFAAIIVFGGVALTFPAAAEVGRISALDALFTSTSAVCVTGLIVVDTPNAFSGFGEAVILVLIQIGGLGIMVLSTFATVILGGRLTLRGERALGDVLELGAPGQAYRLVRFIVLSTLAIEAVGAVILAIAFLNHGVAPADALWRGVFHSISAFCNAGFALQTDSIVMFAADPIPLLVHGALIVLGGLGFVVLAWLWSRGVRREAERAPIQVRVVGWLTGGLVIGCAVLYAVLEWHSSLAGLSIVDKLLNALFQSITTRTAGFNSVDITLMRPATVLLVIVMMFVGAAPGGTAGGIKVTTLAVLAAAIPQIVGARGGVNLFGRSIPAGVLQRAATIALCSSLVAIVALFVLLITENAPFATIAFEVFSALGTVGLSLGITGALTSVGKLTIVATMFLGRIGPLTLALALSGRNNAAIEYPETRIMVG